MKTIRHTASARDKVLHIETEGGIVNITVGLTNTAGQPVTSIEIIPWGEGRGASPDEAWHLDGYSNSRLISRVLPFELVTNGEEVGEWAPWTSESATPASTRCPHCQAIDTIVEVDGDVGRRNRVSVDASDHDGKPFMTIGEGQKNYTTDHYECDKCGAWVLVPDAIDEGETAWT